jgi:hypothetical protein
MTPFDSLDLLTAGPGIAPDAAAHLEAVQERLRETPADSGERVSLMLEQGRALLELERGAEAWPVGREAFDLAVKREAWEEAVDACDILFGADQPSSLVALGHGVWLAVTFPVDPALTLEVLRHIVDETPEGSDGAAVAAAVAHYVVDLRSEGPGREGLMFLSGQLLSTVARRHSQVETQDQFDLWRSRMGLEAPERFLSRLATVVEVLVQGDWWIDRDAIRGSIPAN